MFLKVCIVTRQNVLYTVFLIVHAFISGPTGGMSLTDERLNVGWEELQDLKGVWSELSKIWEGIDEMKDRPWLSIQPRKLRYIETHVKAKRHVANHGLFTCWVSKTRDRPRVRSRKHV